MEEGKEKKIYELALLLKGDDDAARVADLIKQYNGEMVAEPRAKKLALAYTIKGADEAVFVSVLFRALPGDVKQFEHDLNVRQEVLRSMIIVATVPTEGEPTAAPAFPGQQRRGRFGVEPREPRPSAAPHPLSNEALEKKIEEILG